MLVTGATGFVGEHLVRELTRRGSRVSGLGPDPGPAASPLEAWHRCDITDPDALVRAVAAARPEAIVHLAGQSSAGRSFEQPAETFQINVTGTWNLLEAARRAAPGARVLAIGTGETYGPQPEGTRVGEAEPFCPVSPYALSKAAADEIAASYSRAHGLDVVRTRSFAHIGPGQTERFVVPSIARQIAAIEAGAAEPVLKVGNLDVTRDLTDVRDVVLAYVALLERGERGAAYNVCSGTGVTLAEVARRLCERARVAVRTELDPGRLRPADVAYLVGDPGKIRSETGWRAEIPLDRTLVDVLEEWRSKHSEAGR